MVARRLSNGKPCQRSACCYRSAWLPHPCNSEASDSSWGQSKAEAQARIPGYISHVFCEPNACPGFHSGLLSDAHCALQPQTPRRHSPASRLFIAKHFSQQAQMPPDFRLRQQQTLKPLTCPGRVLAGGDMVAVLGLAARPRAWVARLCLTQDSASMLQAR